MAGLKNIRPGIFGMDASGYGCYELFGSLPDGVCIINEQGQIVYFNRAYEKMFRVCGRFEVGRSIFQAKNDDLILTAFREKRNIKGNLNINRETKNISASAYPMLVDGIFRGVLALYTDDPVCNAHDGSAIAFETGSETEEDDSELLARFDEIITGSRLVKKSLEIAYKASKANATVLIRGESGTGKELVAKAIHKNSSRNTGPFVALNCCAVPANLLESEFFGYEQGAFTGAAKRKKGKFEQADGGTIFLDEIGDMPVETQVKLLRVIQEKEFERVGGNTTIKCDIRLIAATHRNLEEMVAAGSFREDLYYRLNVIPIYLPSLRERREDISLLAEHFIKKMNAGLGKNICALSDEALSCMESYDWPGNVRELENLIERIAVLSDKKIIDVEELPSNISRLYNVNDSKEEYNLINMSDSGGIATFEEYEKEIICQALKKFKSFNATGKALGITHKTVAMKARKYNIIDC